jgi:hypothetical protein
VGFFTLLSRSQETGTPFSCCTVHVMHWLFSSLPVHQNGGMMMHILEVSQHKHNNNKKKKREEEMRKERVTAFPSHLLLLIMYNVMQYPFFLPAK